MKLEIKERIVYDYILTFDDGFICDFNYLFEFIDYVDLGEFNPNIKYEYRCIDYLEKNLYVKRSSFYNYITQYSNEYETNNVHELTEKGIELRRELKEIRNYPKNLIK